MMNSTKFHDLSEEEEDEAASASPVEDGEGEEAESTDPGEKLMRGVNDPYGGRLRMSRALATPCSSGLASSITMTPLR